MMQKKKEIPACRMCNGQGYFIVKENLQKLSPDAVRYRCGKCGGNGKEKPLNSPLY